MNIISFTGLADGLMRRDLCSGDHHSAHHLALDVLRAGRLRSEASNGGAQEVRGKRAENNRKAVQSLQSEGRTKTEIARELGIGTTTVDRHWRKADSSEST